MSKRSGSPIAGPSRKLFNCILCGHGFTSRPLLKLHFDTVHKNCLEPAPPGCDVTNEGVLQEYHHLFCRTCGLPFNCRNKLQEHFYTTHPDFNIQDGGGVSTDPITVKLVLESLKMSRKYMADFDTFPCGEGVDERDFFANVKLSSYDVISEDISRWKNLRIFFTLGCHFTKTHADGTVETKDAGFTSFRHLVFNENLLSKVWSVMCSQMSDQIEDFTNDGSGWTLEYIQKFGFVTSKYQFTKIGTYMETPYPLSTHRTLLNIDNSEVAVDNSHNKCFIWSVLAHENIGGLSVKTKRYRGHVDKLVKTYKTNEYILNTKGLHFPMTMEQIPHFEELNPNISLTVLGYDMDGSIPPKLSKIESFNFIQSKISILYNSQCTKEIHVDLMCLMEGNNGHFILIRSLEALMRAPNVHTTLHICRNCLSNFQSSQTLQQHIKYCASLDLQKVVYPANNKLTFNKWERTQPVPFRFYADFEAFLPKFNPSTIEEEERRQLKEKIRGRPVQPVNKCCTHLHKPCGYAWVCVDFNGKRRHGEYYHITSDDEDVAAKFIHSITEYSKTLEEEVRYYEKIAPDMLNLTPAQRSAAALEKNCCFCKKTLDGTKVRHHSHLPPFNYIGMAHQDCNLLGKIKKEFPVFMHNFSSYDVHFIVQSLGKLREDGIIKDISVIPKSSEKYLCLTLVPGYHDDDDDDGNDGPWRKKPFKLRFTDSLGFTLKSLDKLVKVMRADPTAKFPITRQEFAQHDGIELLFNKGAYPYSLMKSCKDFKIKKLPAKEDFYNDLTESHIDHKLYEHAQKVWKNFNIQDMGDWHDLYVRLDVSLLADVMEGIRKIMFDAYELDLAHYFSLPMMAMDCVLKKSGVELELITDPTMHCWLEHAIRGGYVSVGSMREARANNKYMGDEFNPEEDTSYIIYIDANNLYGKSMSLLLPTGEFRWLTEEELMTIQENDFIMDDEKGYMLEVDLEIDPSLHDKLNDYPPAPITRTVAQNELSHHQLHLSEKLNTGPGIFKVKKLVADLNNKKNYILHHAILMEYMKLGVKVTKLHRGISFTQRAWMKDFIDFNTEMRKMATSDFEKDYWKTLNNNSAFGKTIEQVRKRQNVRIVTSMEEALRYNKKPTVQNVIPINESTCIFMMKRLQVTLNKPIYTGVTVLELAKSIMYRHHYTIQAKYGIEKCRLIYTDTDSFIYHIQTDDVYQDMLQDKDLYDMSEYESDHPIFGEFHDPTNKKVLGKFKDEAAGSVITHVVCPRPKMYTIRSLKLQVYKGFDGTNIYQKKTDGSWFIKDEYTKKVKGITKTAVNNQIAYEDFEKVLKEDVQTRVWMRGFRSVEHRIFTEVTLKRALNGLDTKRYGVNRINTLAFGHRNI